MAELKDLYSSTSTLSLLYIDENQKFLTTISTSLSEVFMRVDDANDATIGMGYLKFHKYDIVILDSISDIMAVNQLIKNIKKIHPFIEIIVTIQEKSQSELIDIYKLNVATVLEKPFNVSALLDEVLYVALKIKSSRAFQDKDLEKLNDDLLYERKRIGRSMLNEKKLKEQIEQYKDTAYVNKNIHELTKLPSKYALQSAIDGTKQSLLYINIDHFDFINTTYGMGKANKLLKECGKRLGLFLPKNARLYHITADEFIILIDDPSSGQETLLSSQIQALFKESEIEFDEYSHSIVFSIGIDSGEGKKLFVNAKAASKEARYFGGNQILNYDAHSQYMKNQRESLYWINVLKKAFDDDRIITYYQPIISNASTQTKHYEVLCRLLDDDNNLVDAKKFIHSAKLVGLITQITRTVIDKTFKKFKDNKYNFSINISMHDLHEAYLTEFLTYKCQRYSISADRVHLEIVEDVIIAESESTDKQIQELQEAGFHVIVDDFGTDKSAYSRMFELHAEYIKIDGSFIKELTKSSSHQLVVKSIVDFAKKSGIKTIAEHVESEEVYKIVKELGIDYSQGYYLAKPSLNLE